MCGRRIPIRATKSFSPRRSWRIAAGTVGNHNVWCYIRGEYGGGAWTVERPPGGTQVGTINDEFEYSDIRVAIGVDILPETQNGLRGYFEVGYVFQRHLVFRSGMPEQDAFNRHDADRRRTVVLMHAASEQWNELSDTQFLLAEWSCCERIANASSH